MMVKEIKDRIKEIETQNLNMEKINRLKQLLLTHRTEDISKLTFEQRINFDDAFAQEIEKLFTIPVDIDVEKSINTKDK